MKIFSISNLNKKGLLYKLKNDFYVECFILNYLDELKYMEESGVGHVKSLQVGLRKIHNKAATYISKKYDCTFDEGRMFFAKLLSIYSVNTAVGRLDTPRGYFSILKDGMYYYVELYTCLVDATTYEPWDEEYEVLKDFSDIDLQNIKKEVKKLFIRFNLFDIDIDIRDDGVYHDCMYTILAKASMDIKRNIEMDAFRLLEFISKNNIEDKVGRICEKYKDNISVNRLGGNIN